MGRRLQLLGARTGVRVRSVLVAVAVVLLALLIGGSGLVLVLWTSLEQSAEATGTTRAAEVVSQVAAEGVQTTALTMGERGRADAVTLLLDERGTVVGSSRRSVTGPLSAERPAVGAYRSNELDIDTLDEGGEWKVVTTALRAQGRTWYVQVAVPVRVQRDTVRTVSILLLAAAPLLLVAVGVAVWVLVGRALRSVDQIRTTVAEIDARKLDARLAVPPTHDEIAALARTMNAMLDRLQASDTAQRTFVSDASHELRSPLATLTTAGELAARTPDDEVRSRLLATMNTELARLGTLVADMMTLARVDAHETPVAPVEVDLDDLVDREARRLRATTDLDVRTRVEAVRVDAEPGRVAQPLRNLVDNAARHAARTVVLSLAREGGEAVVRVDNDGPPIEAADRERVFERFVRLDASRSRDAGGSGLGLAIARAGVVSQGGRLAVVDHPAGWCRFELRLPLAGGDGTGDVSGEADGAVAGRTDGTGGPGA